VARAGAARAAQAQSTGARFYVLGVLVWPAAIVLTAAVMTVTTVPGLGGLVSVPTAIVSHGLLTRGRRMRANRAGHVLDGDPRPLIVYLRPFDVDHQGRKQAATSDVFERTPEQRLARALRRIALLVALGDPLEELPQLGAVRMYASDAEWRQRVEELTRRAGTIIGTWATPTAWPGRCSTSSTSAARSGSSSASASGWRHWCQVGSATKPSAAGSTSCSPADCSTTSVDATSYFDADWTPQAFGERGLDMLDGGPADLRTLVLQRLGHHR